MPTLKIFGVPCWIFPILAGLAWLVTILALISTWVAKGSTHYPEMWPIQHLPYISNIGASDWGRPLFITGSIITAMPFSITFVGERWLRHKGRLLHSRSRCARALWTATAILTAIGTSAQVLLTIFCVRHHPYTHYTMVAIFALAYILAAAFMCAEKRHLYNCFPASRTLRWSFYIKLFFLITEIVLVVAGTVTMYARSYRASIMIEWLAATLFTFYVSSFAIDFLAVPERAETGIEAMQRNAAWNEELGLRPPQEAHARKDERFEVH